ncbi:MAG: DNA alkylation repair protein [Sedimentisphaerales bacterium]|nr:DNA alkylation repair protein [Sedimentisphaerales bacterium]MBN2843987.1 DNA alkylation repair protein [Sedimentisphaerales bacterium]
MSFINLKKEINQLADPQQAVHLMRFFKTAPGQYGHGDLFRGIKVPPLRKLVKLYYQDITLLEAAQLLQSKYHEDRLVALLIMVARFQHSSDQPELQQEIYDLYLANIDRINNWDLVDLSCYHIVGEFLCDKDRRADLYNLARHGHCNHADYQRYSLWANRIAIVSTMNFIRKGQFADTIAIADILLDNSHDLIHKAVGWLLREMGKRSQSDLENFLASRYQNMPRTALRYAIEKFPQTTRQKYLKGLI